MRRTGVFVLGAVLGAALFWACAFGGILGFTSVEGAAFSALLLFAVVVADVAIGGFLARTLLRDDPQSEAKRAGLFVGGSLFVGAFASGLFLGAMILLDTASSQFSLFLLATGPGLGLMYGMILGTPTVVGATIVELRYRSREEGGSG